MKKLCTIVALLGAVAVAALLLREYLAVIWIRPSEPTALPTPVSFPVRTSTLALPVEIHVNSVANLVNQLAPREMSGTHRIRAKVFPGIEGFPPRPVLKEGEVAHVDYQVSRGDVQLFASDDRLSFRVPLSGCAKAIPGGSSGTVGGTAHGSTTLAIGSDFNVSSSVDLHVDLDHAVLNLARIRVFNHDVGISIPFRDLAQQKANEAINEIKGRIGAEISKAVNLRGLAEKAWADLPGSIRFPGIENVWLTLNPKAVLLDGPRSTNGVVTATLALQAEMATFIQPTQPAAPQRGQLPSLGSRPGDGRFHVALPVEAQIGELNRLLSAVLKQGGVIKLAENQELTVEQATLFAKCNRLYLKVAFEGTRGFWLRKVKGTIVCGAVPRLDTVKQILHFDQVDFTSETRGALAKSAAWLLRPVIVHELQKRAVLPLSTLLKKATDEAHQVTRKIQLPGSLRLEFRLDKLTAESFAVCGNKVYVQFDAAGTSKLSYGAKETQQLAAARP